MAETIGTMKKANQASPFCRNQAAQILLDLLF